jgi:hypothetical protein
MRQVSIFRTLDLTAGSVIPFTSSPRERVRVLYGQIWLTEEGNPRDAFLIGGEEASLAGRRLAVIEALGPARVHLVQNVPAAWRIGGARAAQARRFVRWLLSVMPRGVRAARGVV